MIRLKSKVQYKNFEQGEYVFEEIRTFDETIYLIQTFPWKEQRENIIIDFTNPGIVIEREGGTYLQVALYYNQKYVLRYFNDKHKLYTRSFDRLQDSFEVIQGFYNTATLDLTLFKNEVSWVMPSYKVFKTKSFEYELNPDVIFDHIMKTSLFRLSILIVFISYICFSDNSQMPFGTKLFFLALCFIFLGGLNILLLLDHFLYFKNKKLVISKGNDTFYYGFKHDLRKFDKHDIKAFEIINPNYGSRNRLIPYISLFIIYMKNGEELIIPNIFFPESDMQNKLNFIPPKYSYSMPFIPPQVGPKI